MVADAYLANIKTELITDQDFADAEANGKNCEDTEKRIQALRDNIIAQMVTVNEVDSALASYQKAFKDMKVKLKNAVSEQKDRIKTNAILKAREEFSTFVREAGNGLPFRLFDYVELPDFPGAIKGVKTIASMHSRINDALANGKASATTLAKDVKTKLAYINEAIKGYEHFFKVHDLAFKDIEFIKLSIQSTIDKENARRAEYEAQVKAKAEADARAKLEAEQRAKPQVTESEAVPLSSQDQVSQSQSSPPFNQKAFEQVFKHNQPTRQDIISLVAGSYDLSAKDCESMLVEMFSTEVV